MQKQVYHVKASAPHAACERFLYVISYVFTARLRWLDATMKPVLIFIFLIHKACGYRSPNSDSSFYCDSVLNKEYTAKSVETKEEYACWLRRYKQRDVAQCLDRMSNHRSEKYTNPSKDINNHFIFVGDSRVRQQFYSFRRVIPLVTLVDAHKVKVDFI